MESGSDSDEMDVVDEEMNEFTEQDLMEYQDDDDDDDNAVASKESPEGMERRPLYNPASLVERPYSYIPYSREDYKDVGMIFESLQVLPDTLPLRMAEIFYSIASVIQTQIKDDASTLEPFALFPIFDVIFSSLLDDEGGNFQSAAHIPTELMEKEDEETRPFIMTGRVPMFYTVFRFMVHLWEEIKYALECNIYALAYINRITAENNMALTAQNWRMVWLVAVMVAQKVWTAKAAGTKKFCKAFTDLDRSQLKGTEETVMHMLDFDTGVEPSMFEKYYTELNILFKNIMKSQQVEGNEEDWDWGPVSKYTKMVIKRKCKKSGDQNNTDEKVGGNDNL